MIAQVGPPIEMRLHIRAAFKLHGEGIDRDESFFRKLAAEAEQLLQVTHG